MVLIEILWSSNSSWSAQDANAQLLEHEAWNRITGLDWFLSPWKSVGDHSKGLFTHLHRRMSDNYAFYGANGIYSDIRGGGRVCLLWFNDLIDIREFAENGRDFYGLVQEGQEIAVKRLSKNSRQGLNKFKNEVGSIADLPQSKIFGKRNRGFCHLEHSFNLLGHGDYIEGRSSKFIDASVGTPAINLKFYVQINLGLLCVQCFPYDRPSMHSVVLMLGSQGALCQPKEPCFLAERNMMEANSSSGTQSTI
ncbi:G-type lectin S-receptor-like serine/threonine-protein kinase [Vitis vinifera]|uniref:G-type lectin S-receptor-like serine/threonine-protein kinase n=1 Tax=Vitis vinifera TaxID=29760 RepID=A0A438G8Z9_VITVI|nr:G-type lectin S-receptor-like serine/threonine-protein kinase [Vitis vinifera]